MKVRTLSEMPVHAAAFGAAALIASQVAGKAVRDAFFLSHFGVSALPAIVILASILSILAGVITARLISTFAPNRLLPIAFIGSSIVLLVEWSIAGESPRLAAVLIYLQMAIVGSILISGFWTLLGDRFDARSARKEFGRIVAASAFGGVVGGLLAERVGSSVGVTEVLPILAFFHLVCAWLTRSMWSKRAVTRRASGSPKRKSMSSFAVLGTVPYIRNLALLVLFSTIGTSLLDYAFKVRVSAGYADSAQLVRIFAVFYATVGVATFLVQLVLNRIAVEKAGVAGAVGSLPMSLTLGGIGGLLIPGLPMAFAMRGGEALVRSSLFRSGYEMLYAAVPRRERQATKSILDVGVERIADLLGAILLGAISWMAAPRSTTVVLILAAALGGAGVWISRRLQRGYVQALENSLLSQTVTVQGSSKIERYATALSSLIWNPSSADKEQRKGAGAPVLNPPLRDAVLLDARDLRSGNPDTVRTILRQPLSPTLGPHLIALLAWDDVSDDAIGALQKMGPKIVGQLVDAMLDPEQEFAIRRRVPRVLATLNAQRGVDGLIDGLADARFEVRFQAAQALSQIQGRNPAIVINKEAVIRAVEREFEIEPEGWRYHRVLDTKHEEPAGAIAVEHVFRLLSLAYASEPLQIAYRALKSGDDYRRHTSLEYLEQILPLGVWQRILPLVEDRDQLVGIL